jgi:hypothetical protein
MSHFCLLLPVDSSGCWNARVKEMANWTKVQVLLELFSKVSRKSLPQYHQMSVQSTV